MVRHHVNTLQDRFGRTVNYLRISVTDRCDLRCVYCMSEKMQFLPRSELLTLDELAYIGQTFVSLGVKKIRLTGGEPLVRRGVIDLIQQLARCSGLRELVMTTNGSQLVDFALPLKQAGIGRLNISLDTLHVERYKAISRVGDLQKVLAGIDAACAADFERIKINAVILRGRNEDEVVALARYAMERGMDISYIEEMPLGNIEHSRKLSFYSSDAVLHDLKQEFSLTPVSDSTGTGGPSRYYAVQGYRARIGIIAPHTCNFCDTCNRVRLTCDGRLLLCLGREHSVSLRDVVRQFPNDVERLRAAIIDSMLIKPKGHEFVVADTAVLQRHMNVTGG